MSIRPDFKNLDQFKRKLQVDYANTYGLEFPLALLKRYTTNPSGNVLSSVSVAHYNLHSSGFNAINSEFLNPIGRNTTFEAIVLGSGKPLDMEGDPNFIDRNANNARTFGLKTPFTYVGWGYDIFGHPAPNLSREWTASGVLSATGIKPSGTFWASGTPGFIGAGGVPSSIRGSDTNEKDWLAGPLDLRWDNHRKVWTGNHGIYPATIVKVSVVDGGDPSQPQFAQDIKYNATVYDGVNSGIMVTGLRPAMPYPDNYMVHPIPTGTPCVIINVNDNGRPRFGLLAWEKPYAELCPTTASSPSVYLGGGWETGLAGFTHYSENYILIGDATGTLDRRLLTASTGIIIIPGTGDLDLLRIGIDPSVSFNTSGINTQITALPNLSTPLTIAQGGTGATGKIFVDFTTNQNIGGIKTFSSGILLPSGTSSNLYLKFNNQNGVLYGIGYNNSGGLFLVSSGIVTSNFYPTGILFNQETVIKPTYAMYSPLTVYQQTGGYSSPSGEIRFSTNIQEWRKQVPTGLYAAIDTSGMLYAQGIRVSNSGRTAEVLFKPSVISSNIIVNIPATGGTLALVDQIPIANLPFTKVSGYYNVLSTDRIIFVNTNATGSVITLPDATTVGGKVLTIKDWAGLSNTNPFTINTFPTGQKIDGSNSINVNTNYLSRDIVSDSINWYLI